MDKCGRRNGHEGGLLSVILPLHQRIPLFGNQPRAPGDELVGVLPVLREGGRADLPQDRRDGPAGELGFLPSAGWGGRPAGVIVLM
jgi:hypothetical protein